MPKSKRDKKVSLTKTTKKGLVLKKRIVEDIRNAIGKFDNVFLFTIHNMRNANLKDLRIEWKDSRFFFGKNKVMALALGKDENDETEEHISKLSKRMKGQCGLLLTNRPVSEVLQFFSDYEVEEYARTCFKPKEDVMLTAGPLPQFSHAMEPHLRKLGMPTSLEKGVITLIKDFQVCKKGSPLTSDQANILKLLDRKLATFKLVIKCHWTKGVGFSGKDVEIEEESENDEDNEDEMEEDEG